ncbi:hypothetical protein GCM10010172_47720 [Paractinoplanes ferrugineus]|uniref:S9 family peptidase n=1 Tax=Paractinoplanes ferrugineus TaxID=113564 RepID=A0A919J4C2_9ACTN|nr:hypothetical protein [Actinoplanes ferrugineus]GIE10356.1 hypothetical protein Afe05nite_21960 [Actinoplanes ferrugineus]
MISGRQLVSLGVALVAAAAMVGGQPGGKQKPAPPVNARVAWPQAQRANLPATLADGAAYEPAVFLDADRSVGTAPTPDRRALRLVLRDGNGSVRTLRTLPLNVNPSIESPTLSGTDLVWAESSRNREQLWTIDLASNRPARLLTADVGDARFYESQYDLVFAQGRVHWVAAGADDTTEIRSVALGGGAVSVRSESGAWSLSAWPWLINGVTAAGGTTVLRDMTTGQDRRVVSPGRGVTACGPLWCRVVAFDKKGYPQIDVMRPDGSDRRRIAGGTAATAIADNAVLDRFEIYSMQTDNSDLTGYYQVLAYDINRRSTVEISPEATDVSYRAGVLWWSTGSQDQFVRHSLDLRTV